ncbi:MAG: HlyD family secretion protein, partial [Planctomycetota bacterium]
RPIKKNKWTPKRITAIIGGLLFLSFTLYGFLKDRGVSRLHVETEKLTISKVERGPFREFVPVRGAVEPIRTVYFGALEGGRVEEIMVEEGALVEEGEVIMRLVNEDLTLQVLSQETPLQEQLDQLRNARLQMQQKLLQSRQRLLDVEFQLQQKQRIYERYASFSERDLVAVMPRADFEKLRDDYTYYKRLRDMTVETLGQDSLLANLQVEQMQATVERTQRNVAIVRKRLDKLVVRAPVTGQLTVMVEAEIGTAKNRGERLGQVDVLDGFKVRAVIDEFYIGRIARGLGGEFDLGDESYRLEVVKVYPEVKAGRFAIDLEFSGVQPVGIRRGQTLHIRLFLDTAGAAILLARGGFYQQTGGNWIYVLDADGQRANKRNIRLGRQNPNFFEVLEGVQPGERVITSSYDNFGDMDVLLLQ